MLNVLVTRLWLENPERHACMRTSERNWNSLFVQVAGTSSRRKNQISARLAFRRFFKPTVSETGSIFKVIEFQTDFQTYNAAALPYERTSQV